MLYQKERAFLSGFYQRPALSTFLLFVWYFKSWGHINIFFSFLKRSVPPEKGEVGSKAVHQGGVHPRQPPHLLSDYPSHLTSVPAAQHFLFLRPVFLHTFFFYLECPCSLSIRGSFAYRLTSEAHREVFLLSSAVLWARLGEPPYNIFTLLCVCVHRPLLVNMERTP